MDGEVVCSLSYHPGCTIGWLSVCLSVEVWTMQPGDVRWWMVGWSVGLPRHPGRLMDGEVVCGFHVIQDARLVVCLSVEVWTMQSDDVRLWIV